MSTQTLPTPTLTRVGRLTVAVGPVVDAGATPAGHVRMVPILGGRLEGWLGAGEVVSGGADWQVLHDDGSLTIDARYAIQLESGPVITVTSSGVRTTLSPSGEVYFRTAIRIGAPASVGGLGEVVRRLYVSAGVRRETSVALDLFELG